MSTNPKLQTPKIHSETAKVGNNPFLSSEKFSIFSPEESKSNININKLISYSQSNSKMKIKPGLEEKEKIQKFPQSSTINLSTNYQTFSRNNPLENENKENEIEFLADKINNVYNSSSSSLNNYCNNLIYNKPRLSLKDSRTKIKQLREKLYNLTEEEKIREQENLLPVPLNKMNDEKYKLLKMHNLKKKSLPEYKSCTKFDEYYKPFEKTIDNKNEYFLLKKKKSVYSTAKHMILELNLSNKNKEKSFPLYKDQDIGVYEYWQVPLIESKIDEDNDSDNEQINLATKVCNLDLYEGIKYVQQNGLNDILNRIYSNGKMTSKVLNKSMSA